jgi:cytoskeletal protein RodZ
MKQYNTFEDLQALGTEKIHEQTHISRDKVELVMNKAYEKIGRVQFMGYISILEREYSIDLSGIKEEYTEFCSANAQVMAPKASVILQAPSSSRSKWVIAGIAVIILLMVGGYWLQAELSNAPQEEVMNLTTSAVEVVEEVEEANLSETNETNVTASASVVNLEKNVSTPAALGKTVASGKQLIIHPTYKVWYGMINMATSQRTQKITSDPIVIDTDQNWLIVMGHGRIEIEYPEGKTVLNDKNTVHFVCENGALKQINQKEFTERNGGKNW